MKGSRESETKTQIKKKEETVTEQNHKLSVRGKESRRRHLQDLYLGRLVKQSSRFN